MSISQNKTFNGCGWTFFNRYHMEIFKDLAYLKMSDTDSRIVFNDGSYFIILMQDVYAFKKAIDKFFAGDDTESESDKILEFLIYRKPFGKETSVTTTNWIINFHDKTLKENNAITNKI